uniref:Uncharacterized protein n=1 Tax=Trichogramma kaykai TaxID=54128 RepID=A0ABD2XH62_9HYME
MTFYEIKNIVFPSPSRTLTNETTMKCTQFKLGNKEIDWFSANISVEDLGRSRVMYNLPEGEGFLTVKSVVEVNEEDEPFTVGKYLVKIKLDGKSTQSEDFLTECAKYQEDRFTKLSETNEGRYRLSGACVKNSYDANTHDLRRL